MTIDSGAFKKYHLDHLELNITENRFALTALQHNNTLLSRGEINPDGTGELDTIFINYHQVQIANIAPIEFDLFGKRIEPCSFRFASGELYLSLIEGTVKLVDCQLEDIARFTGLKETIRGLINLSLDKSDSLFIRIDGIYYRGLNNGRVLLNSNYQRDKIIIKQLSISDDNEQNLTAKGFVALKDSKIKINFKNIRPWVLPFLNNFMEKPDGLLNGEIEFSGDLEEFRLKGNAEIKDASFGINVIGARFDSGYAQVRFSENQILFETIKSRVYSGSLIHSGIKSWVSGGGVVKLEPKFAVKNFRFDFSFQNAPLQYQNLAYGIGTGNISLVMKDEIMSYNGNINIKEGIIPIEFGTRLETGAEEKQANYRMNLKISAERNIWLRNRDTDIEFGGEVYFIKEKAPLYISGMLETKRGNYYWLNHILKITSGKITFIPQEIIDPELDFWAELNTRERDPNTNQEIKILLHCTGPISEPVLEFFSDPPIYSEQDILTYLNLNITWHELESMKQGEYVGRILPQTILAWLESDVSRRLRAYTGLDYFRIEAPFFSPEEKTKLTVGKYVSKKLFITYTYDITSFSNEFNVEYFIDDRNEILIKRDETGEYNLQYQYRIRF